MSYKKECLHEWASVYYGSEWVLECKKCKKDVFDTYSNEVASEICQNKII